MKLTEKTQRTSELITRLLTVWERSVKATHTFLSGEEIARIKEYVPQALEQVPHLILLEDENGAPAAFMGIAEQRLEMLFLAPEVRGMGYGKRLLQYGIERYAVQEVTVNEQNPQAAGFYEHMGFRTYRRTERDEQGGPYPLLYMRRMPPEVQAAPEEVHQRTEGHIADNGDKYLELADIS